MIPSAAVAAVLPPSVPQFAAAFLVDLVQPNARKSLVKVVLTDLDWC